MYLYTIIAFAFLFWQGEQPGRWIPLAEHDVAWTLTLVLSQPFLVALTAWIALRRWRGLIAAHPSTAERGQRFYHRATFAIRCGILAGFAATIFSSRWTDWFALGQITPVLQIAGDVIILTPFVVNLLVLWIITYPAETMVRSATPVDTPPIDGSGVPAWRFRSYLGFHLRHYVLVVGAPLILILFAADLTRSYGATIVSWTGWMWTPDALLAAVAFVVFLAAPVLLCRIWRTSPLAPGVVRDRLEQCATRIGLRFREILVWKTDGIMINAATMGLLARVRYVLLSDALLDTMDTDQVEAVFGHEAGHVHHHHIQYFLAFAIVGWVLVAALMEVLAYLSTSFDLPPKESLSAIEIISVTATIAFWGIGFGWVSRRFEWQADLFGAQCVTPPPSQCLKPCSVHPDESSIVEQECRVCMTGATIFASALERVAILNGIPRDERSWRHSSIDHRIRRLFSLAGDPSRARRFNRTVRRLQRFLVTGAVIGLMATVCYLLIQRQPAILRLQTRIEQQPIARRAVPIDTEAESPLPCHRARFRKTPEPRALACAKSA